MEAPTHLPSTMSEYIVKKDEASPYRLTSVRDLLKVSPRCGYTVSKNGILAECGCFLEDWKQNITTTLLQQIAQADTPSRAVNHMLEQLSKNRICDPCQYNTSKKGNSPTKYCSEIRRDWQRRIWEEYLKENGLQPGTVTARVPRIAEIVSWEAALGRLKKRNSGDARPLEMRNKQQEHTQSQTSAPASETKLVLRADTQVNPKRIYLSIQHDPDDVYTDHGPGSDQKTTATVTQQSGRPSVQRELATLNIPKAVVAQPQETSQKSPKIFQETPKTPAGKTVPVQMAEDVSSPQSDSSRPPSPLFDRDVSPEDGTPLSIYETSCGSEIESPSESQEKGHRRPRKDPGGVTGSHVDSSLSEPPQNKSKPRREEQENTQEHQSDTPTKKGHAVQQTQENAAIAVQSVAADPVQDFVKHSDETNIFIYGLKKIRKVLVESQVAPGYVYCYRHEEHPGYLKIGSATCRKKRRSSIPMTSWKRPYHMPEEIQPWDVPREVESRHKAFEASCKYKAIPVFTYAMPCAAPKMERLVHAELRTRRYHVINCNPESPCKEVHNEWFEVPVDVARDAVKRWQRFSKCEPYDEHGKLNAVWEAVTNHSLQKRVSGSEADLAAWIDLHTANFVEDLGKTAMSVNRQAKKELKTGARNVAALFDQEDMIGKLKKAHTLFM